MTATELYYFKGVVAYDGTNFQGWQSQVNGKGVQDHLLAAMEEICPSNDNRVVGCGRTDSGVHAHHQIISLRSSKKIPPSSLQKALNTRLVPEIRVKFLETCSEEFHPLKNIIKKEYRYFFSTAKFLDPCLNNYVLSYPFPVDTKTMVQAAECFLGEHDFVHFSNTGSEVKDSIRTILASNIQKIDMPFMPFIPDSGDIYQFQVIGKGFLKQMVRNMMGSLLMVGRGKISEDELKRSLAENVPLPYKYCAPARGLHQIDVKYLD